MRINIAAIALHLVLAGGISGCTGQTAQPTPYSTGMVPLTIDQLKSGVVATEPNPPLVAPQQVFATNNLIAVTPGGSETGFNMCDVTESNDALLASIRQNMGPDEEHAFVVPAGTEITAYNFKPDTTYHAVVLIQLDNGWVGDVCNQQLKAK